MRARFLVLLPFVASVYVVAPAPAHAQRTPALKKQPPPPNRVPDAAMRARVDAFIAGMADSMASYIDKLPTGFTGDYAPYDSTQAHRAFETWAYLGFLDAKAAAATPGGRVMHPVVALDSLRVLWTALSAPSRADWLISREGVNTLGLALVEIARAGHLVETSRAFAGAIAAMARQIDAGDATQTRIGEPGEAIQARTDRVLRQTMAAKLMSSSRMLEGLLLIARGDTAAAVSPLLEAARTPSAAKAQHAARTLAKITRGRQDKATEHLLGATLAYLEASEPAEKAGLYAVLQPAYARYVAKHERAPDVLPDRENAPAAKGRESLDAYLDRQFDVLYDRQFLIAPAAAPASGGGRTRLVVGEFLTGVF